MEFFNDPRKMAAMGVALAGLFFLIQLYLCFKAKRRYLQLVPLAVLAVFGGVFVALGDKAPGFLGLVSIGMGIAVVLAWIVYGLEMLKRWRLRQSEKKAQKEETPKKKHKKKS